MSDAERTRSVERLGSVGEERAALAPLGIATPAAPSVPTDVWTAPEPWQKRLLRAGKVWVIATITHYSLTQFMDVAGASLPRAVAQSVFMGFWAATISFVGSRTGSLMPASPMLVLGGVSVGAGVLVGVTAMIKGAGSGGAALAASMGLFLGGIMLWMGLKARRAERALADGQRSEKVAPVLISRAELATRLEAIQQEQASETRRFGWWIGGSVTALLGVLAFPYERVFGADLPEAVGAVLFFGMWGAAGLAMRYASRRARELAARFGLVCAACDETYSGAFVNHRFLKNIVEIGRCPRCGARIVTEDGT